MGEDQMGKLMLKDAEGPAAHASPVSLHRCVLSRYTGYRLFPYQSVNPALFSLLWLSRRKPDVAVTLETRLISLSDVLVLSASASARASSGPRPLPLSLQGNVGTG